jgi:tripartite-type tricarboxylate transporter receptor subunit TctC
MPVKLPRRTFLNVVAGAVALPTLPHIAVAQSYPRRPVRIVVGFPASNASDIVTRLAAQIFSERLGQQFIVDNRPGAGGNIGTEIVVKAPPDGYTLLSVSPSATTNATLYQSLNFNFLHDIAPVAGIARAPYLLVLTPSFPATTIPEFITYAKANPGKINMASAGTGSLSHMCGELFMTTSGISMVHVPYRGSFLPDLIAGQVQVVFSPISQSIGYIRSGRLRVLAVTTSTRQAALPEVPSVAEFVADYEASGWYGVGAPRNTPSAIIERLNEIISSGLAEAKIEARLADLGAVPMPMTPGDFSQFLATETEKWAKVIKSAGIKPE